jgi:hypothetical protein
MHSIGVIGPRHKMLPISLELLLHGLDMRRVFEEKDLVDKETDQHFIPSMFTFTSFRHEME